MLVHGPSRCACCLNAEESVTHIFFSCNWAKKVWSFLYNITGIAPAHGIHSLKTYWLGKSPVSLSGGLRIAWACFALWEIWRARNIMIHEGRNHHIIKATMQWIRLSSHLIKLPFDPGKAAKQCSLMGLGVRHPLGSWRRWYPCHSVWTVNLAIIQKDLESHCSVIVRDIRGGFLSACCRKITALHGLHELTVGINIAINHCRTNSIWPFNIQSSNIFIGDILFAKEQTLPWRLIYLIRALRNRLGRYGLHRVTPPQNNAAIAMASRGEVGTFSSFSDLPVIVQRIIQEDISGLPRFCSQLLSDEDQHPVRSSCLG